MRLLVPALMALSFAAASPVAAPHSPQNSGEQHATQEQWMQQWQTQPASDAQARQMQPQRRTYRLQGTVDGSRRITLRRGQQHTLVRVRTGGGRTAIVDLGPRHTLADLNLRTGDRIEVRGVRAMLNGRPVLVARQARPAGQPQNVQQAPTQRARFANQRDRRRGQIVRRIIRDWPSTSKQAAQEMVNRYGPPDAASPRMLVWHNNGPWERSIVHRQEVPHNFPVPHQDVLEQTVPHEVPADKLDDLAQFDGSIIVWHTGGLLSARCHAEPMNILALNLAHDIIAGNTSAEEAKQTYAQTAQAWMRGESPAITQQLQFQTPPVQRVRNPGEQVVQGSDGAPQQNRAQESGTQQQPQQSPQQDGNARTVTMTARNFNFNPSRLVVQPGQTIRLQLENSGEAPHNITFDLPQQQATFDQNVSPGNSRTLTFTAPQEPGTYNFWCPVADHREMGMTGTLVVQRQQ